MLPKKSTQMKEILWKGREPLVNTQYEKEGKARWEIRTIREASANQTKEGWRTNLRALCSLCGRLASGGSRRFRDT